MQRLFSNILSSKEDINPAINFNVCECFRILKGAGIFVTAYAKVSV